MLGQASLGRYALGQTSTVLAAVVAGTGAFTLAGQATLSHQTRRAGTGAFTLTGQAAGRRITALLDVGAFTLAGQTTLLARGYRLTASPTISTYGYHPLFAALGQLPLGGAVTGQQSATTFTFTGNNADFDRVTGLLALPGTFTITWPEVDFVSPAYPAKIRLFPRVGRGTRGRSAGGGPNIRTSSSGMRARAFGG